GGIIGDPGNYVDVSCCINYGNVGGYAYKGGTCIVGGIVSRKQLWNSFGIKHCYNLASAISSTVQQKVNGSWEDIEGNAGRICTWATVQEECYSLDSTLVNGKLPTDEIGPDKINGGSLSYEDIQIAISGNYAGDSNVISTFPEKGEENVDPMLYGEGYNITVCFDDVVTKGTGNIDVINLDTNEITSFDINSDSQVSVDESVLTISNVKLPYGAHMCVVFENGCVNVGGKKFFGLSDQKDWEFTTKRFCTGLNIILGKDTFSFVNTEKDIGVSKGSPYPVNIMNWDMFLINNNFSVDDIAAIYNASKQMGGVCFGMSSVFVQNYYNTLNLGDLNNLEKPAKSPSTQELIGLNQYVVAGSKYRKVREQFTNQYTPVKRIKYLYELANSINKTKKPILIDYCWVGNENEEEEDARMKAHAVIAYGLDTEGSPYVYGGREYAYKIKVIDPNYLYSKEDTGDNRCIYITEDLQECIIPKSGTTASSIGTDTLVYSDTLQNNNDMQFQFITDDYEYIVPRGSVTIESPTISFITDTIIINGEKVDSFSVSGEPWVKSVAYLPSDDSNEYAITQIRVEKMDYDIQIPHGTFSYNEDGLYISVTANSFADFKIAKSGTITLDTDSPYELSITAKDISSSESVNNVIISGEEAQNLVIDTNKEIIDIESNNLNGTSIQTGDVLQKDVNKIEIKTDTKTVSISPDNTSVNLEYNDKTKIDTAIIRVSDQYYSGESLFPAVEVICNGLVLQENIDYLISYNNNIKLGTATIEVSGIGTYIGTKTVTFNIVEKDHRWNPWRIVKVSTCTSNGISKRTCSICGKSEEKAVPSTGHKWGNWSVKAKATVFASEQQERICSSCGEKETRTDGKKLVPTIKLNVSSIPLKVKQSTNKVIVSGLANGDSIKSWSSSNTSIVKVNKKTGKITAQKKTGKALVTVTLASGKTAKVTVTVQKQDVKTTKISKLPAKITLEKGRTSTLKPVITPVTSLEKIAYKTSNKKVATVSGKGVVVAKGPGTAKITVASGKKKVTVKVTVPKATTKKVSNVKASVEIPKGKSYTLKPKLYPADSTDTITYTSSNKNIATVSSKGKITGKKKGSTTITVKSGKIKVTCKVTVK
ncbi:MAG: Ig-like domain-containing protein, partial [Candidatus Choladocola sp.]|nr:Ig-like domain-containing protein [Candidatus Choladocola sp.]